MIDVYDLNYEEEQDKTDKVDLDIFIDLEQKLIDEQRKEHLRQTLNKLKEEEGLEMPFGIR